MLIGAESDTEPFTGDRSSRGVSGPVFLVLGGMGDDPVELPRTYRCARLGMNGESDLDIGREDASLASITAPALASSYMEPRHMLEFVVLSMLRTPYVLSCTSWAEEAIFSTSSLVGMKNDKGVVGPSLPPACLDCCCLVERAESWRS